MSPTKILSCVALIMGLAPFVSGQEPVAPVIVKFHEPKTDATEVSAPVDPTVRVTIAQPFAMSFGVNADGARLTFSTQSIRTTFKIDNQLVTPNTARPMPLPPATAGGKARRGFFSTFVYGDLHITQTIEAIPSRPEKPGDKRHVDTAMVCYLIENKGAQPRSIATRVRVDTYCRSTDGPLFAAPTMPKQILDGLELKEKNLPPYVQVLERPDLNNPGFVAHFTLKLGSRLIGPDRFLCTAHFAGQNGWDVPILKAMGDSDAVLYWKPQIVPLKGKVELAYAYGKGLASTPGSEGQVSVMFGGSFEPNKLFTITATVDDPQSGQTLALDLPPGMELVHGMRMQPVPLLTPEAATSLVLWKCRVKELGEHSLRILSSNGITQTRTITVTRGKL